MTHSRPVERFLVVALCAAIGWFYVWTVRSSGDPWNYGQEQRDYYNLLIDGYLAGQLHLKVDVPAELLALNDPYDPALRPPGLGLHDASFYQGKYYLYFGAAPMVVLMLPYRILTGTDLPQAVAALVFVYGAFLASAWLWLAVRRRYFSETGTFTAVIGVLVLGLAGLGPVLLRRPHMWELPIGAGYCFAMLTLACIWRSLRLAFNEKTSAPSRASLAWFAAAGLCLGLAVASRPTYLLAGPLMVVPLVAWWRFERRLPWRPALAGALPLALIGGLMAWHNYARFGDPLQFGQAYQFSLDYESKMAHFRATHVPFNLWRYFFSAAEWSPYFPFIQPAALPPKPPGFGGHDDVYGILRNLPIAWFALCAPLAVWRREQHDRRVLGTWLATVAVLFAAMAGILIFFFGSLARYQSDFTPTLMLLACVGFLAVERWIKVRPRAAVLAWRAVVTVAAACSVVFAVLFSLQLDGLLAEQNPVKARAVAQALNRIPAAFDQVRGVKHGAAEVVVRCSRVASGEQVLLSVGDAPRATTLFVRFHGDDHIQLVVAPPGSPALESRLLAWDHAKPHTVRVTLGALLPPSTHPFFKDIAPSVAHRLTRRVRVELDGEPVLDALRPAGGGGRLRFGHEAAAPVGMAFQGELISARRTSIAPVAPDTPPSGFVRLRLKFPDQPASPREPVLVAGTADHGALLFVEYAGDTRRVAFGISRQGRRQVAPGSIPIDPRRSQELTLRSVPATAADGHLEVRLDDVLAATFTGNLPVTGALTHGLNSFDEPNCASRFSGEIFSVQRSRDGADPLFAPLETVKLAIELPRDRRGIREPLLVTGRTGAGDFLMVEYVDEKTVRFALDHWGSATLLSPPLPLDFSRRHEIAVTLSSLVPPPDVATEYPVRRGRVRIAVDGLVHWEQAVDLFTAEADEFAIGRNPIGGTSCGPVFSGRILAADRVPP